ncbi:MAG: glycosyltransferase [Minisyncoccia bacterium]
MMTISQIILSVSLFISLFFEIFVLITYFEAKEELKLEEDFLKRKIEHYPSVTIVVPGFNEGETVTATVNSLLSLDYPKDKLFLMLIDDGSTDNTFEVMNRFKDNPQIQIFKKENGGKFTALNFALERIKTDLIGCLDADSFVAPDALKLMVPFFNNKEVMAVTPSIKVHEERNVLQKIQKIEYNWGIFFRRMLSSLGAMFVTPGPFSIFRTKVFKDLGGYRHGHHTEDMELAMRMQKNHYKIVNSVGAHVYTITPKKFKALYKQRTRWTYGFLNNVVDYKELFFNKKYGHIGFFVLPIALISIASTLYAAANIVWNISIKLMDLITRFQAVGFYTKFPTIRFDWFFFNTSILTILVLIALAINISLLVMSARMAREERLVGRALFYYVAMYAFLVPTWIAKATYSTVFSRKISWR